MSLVLKDRVKETASAPGTGPVTLLGAVTGHQAFSVVGNGNTCYYCIADQAGANWEVGIGTWATGGTLARTAANVLAGSAGAGTLVDFSSGIQDVFLTVPADMLTPQEYYLHKCALLEPDAIETPQLGAFTYTPAAFRWMIAGSWVSLSAGLGGSLDVRDTKHPVPLITGQSVYGIRTGAGGLFLDPSRGSYPNPQGTFYQRKLALWNSTLKFSPVATASYSSGYHQTLLPGPYGSIIRRVNTTNLNWILAAYINGATNWHLTNEVGQANTQTCYFDNDMYLPVSKCMMSELYIGLTTNPAASDNPPYGGVAYILLPSTWSKVTDPLAPYAFRDDFMGASLGGAVWDVTQSAAGQVAINTDFAWCKVTCKTGDAWGANGMKTHTYNVTRAAGKKMLFDVYAGLSSSTGQNSRLIVGLGSGSGIHYTDLAHSILFGYSAGNVLEIYEDGNDRGAVGSGWTYGCIYRFRITPLVGGGATYEVQGGTKYEPLGGALWTDITPGTSASAVNTFYPTVASAYVGQAVAYYIGDVRVY